MRMRHVVISLHDLRSISQQKPCYIQHKPVSPADHMCGVVVSLWLQHISLANIISFKLSTHSNGLVIYLGMYVAFSLTANSL